MRRTMRSCCAMASSREKNESITSRVSINSINLASSLPREPWGHSCIGDKRERRTSRIMAVACGVQLAICSSLRDHPLRSHPREWPCYMRA